MSARALSTRRLDRQLIARPRLTAPAEVVEWFGAMQAQDYLAALWAVGLRTRGATEAGVEAALAAGGVIRTHLFRGTWQYVARDDVRWMLDLMGARVLAAAASRYRELELDDRTLGRCGELLARALEGGRTLTRPELAGALARRIPAVARRLSHILAYAELTGVICGGARRGKQPTYALLDERAPRAPSRTREEALAELAVRYFRSRGPATERDFAWWTGLTLGDAREALRLASAALVAERVAGGSYWCAAGSVARARSAGAHLLPAFDEYLIGYRDRSALVATAHARKLNDGGGMLSPAVVLDGQVVATWKRTLGRQGVAIAVRPFSRLSRPEREAVAAAARRYGAFLGLAARVAC